MRVRIKKYVDSYLPSYRIGKLFGLEHPSENRFINWLDAFFSLIKVNYCYILITDWMSERRVSVKIDKWDSWDACNTLAYVILPLLKQLRETKHGAPTVDPLDVPEYLRPEVEPNEENGYVDSTHFERWDWVLDEMIFAFENLNEDWSDQFYSGEADYLWLPFDENGNQIGGPLLFDSRKKVEGVKYWQLEYGPKHTLICDTEGLKAFDARINNGLILFGKYYRSLWD